MNCEYYALRMFSVFLIRLGKVGDDYYLCVMMVKSVLLMKWAPHPFSRFMKLKVRSCLFY